VSLLDRLGVVSQAGRHLSDDNIAEVWTNASTQGGPAVPTPHPHLRDCADCRARYTAFAGWLDGLRNDARADADEAFPPERLAVQQAQIFRRLESVGRPARVIAFPRFAGPVSMQRPRRQASLSGSGSASSSTSTDLWGRPIVARGCRASLKRSPSGASSSR
jgi:hypothetical protein